MNVCLAGTRAVAGWAGLRLGVRIRYDRKLQRLRAARLHVGVCADLPERLRAGPL